MYNENFERFSMLMFKTEIHAQKQNYKLIFVIKEDVHYNCLGGGGGLLENPQSFSEQISDLGFCTLLIRISVTAAPAENRSFPPPPKFFLLHFLPNWAFWNHLRPCCFLAAVDSGAAVPPPFFIQNFLLTNLKRFCLNILNSTGVALNLICTLIKENLRGEKYLKKNNMISIA